MNYPFELQRREAAAIRARREKAVPIVASASEQGEGPTPDPTPSGIDLGLLPPQTVGLALSGGGIGSATFGLGILQALAKKRRLRDIDFLSSTSGGGYTGSFLGRLFTRPSTTSLAETKSDPCAHVESILADNASPQIEWLRENATYLAGTGGSDVYRHLAVSWRNLVTVYLIFALLGFALFGLLRLAGDWTARFVRVPCFGMARGSVAATALSSWWWLPLAVFGVGVVPCAIAYWLAPKENTRASFSFFPIAAWITLLALLGLAAGLVSGYFGALIAISILLLAAIWLEVARRQLTPNLDPSAGETSADAGTVIRNRLTRGLGEGLVLLLACVAWAAIDTVARDFALGKLNPIIATWILLVAAVSPFMRRLSRDLCGRAAKEEGSGRQSSLFICANFRAGVIAFPVAGLLFVLLDGAVHWLFNHHCVWGFAALLAGALLSLIFGRAFDFLNYSALPDAQSARISCTCLGASNPARIFAEANEPGRDIQVVHPDDDIAFDQYHPEVNGGPLHLIGLCVNETVDAVSRRGVRKRKGLPMCVGPCGVSVGRKFHAIWAPPPPENRLPFWMRLRQLLDRRDPPSEGAKIALRAVPVPGEVFHVFAGRNNWPVCVESLRLSRWIATSGATFGMGSGRATSLPLFLLLGLANLRLGYWWDSGLNASDRPGHFIRNFWSSLKAQPAALVKMQSLLISDFLGRFQGVVNRFWNITDGGHFDNTGIYELLRRRVPFIIAVDGGEDASVDFDDMAELVRQARIDFGAEVEFVDGATVADNLPPWILGWLSDPARTLGSLQEIGSTNRRHAALAHVTYQSDQKPATWIVLLKASVTGDESLDVANYQKKNPAFPNESATGISFNNARWEAFRALGEHIGDIILSYEPQNPNAPDSELIKNIGSRETT
jgi:predicted acylesterase/phospholipase RssA